MKRKVDVEFQKGLLVERDALLAQIRELPKKGNPQAKKKVDYEKAWKMLMRKFRRLRRAPVTSHLFAWEIVEVIDEIRKQCTEKEGK